MTFSDPIKSDHDHKRAHGRRRLARRAYPAVLGGITAALALAPASKAGTIAVTTTADHYGQNAASCSLREAIKATNDDADFGGCDDSGGADVVSLAAETYVLTRAGADDNPEPELGDLDVVGDLRLRGASGGGGSAIDAGGIDRVLEFHVKYPSTSSTARLERLTIQGGDAPVTYTSDGGGILSHRYTSLVIEDSVVRDNQAPHGAGGGIWAGTLTLRRTSVQGNAANSGAGIEVNNNIQIGAGTVGAESRSLEVIESAVTGNDAVGSGGGIHANDLAAIAVRRSTVSDNTAERGAGIFVAHNDCPDCLHFPTTVTLSASELSGNRASLGGGGLMVQGFQEIKAVLKKTTVAGNDGGARGRGGAIKVMDSSGEGLLQLDASTLSGNTAGSGGAVYSLGTVAATNTTVSDNASNGSGGGVLLAGASASLRNATVTQNTADANANGTGNGGGIASEALASTPAGSVTVSNTILAGNRDLGSPHAVDCAGSFESRGYNFVGDARNCGFPAGGSGDFVGFGLDPRLGPLADNGGPTETHALLDSSLAIDRGNPDPPRRSAACAPTDQRGVRRPQGARCDIGAYERVP